MRLPKDCAHLKGLVVGHTTISYYTCVHQKKIDDCEECSAEATRRLKATLDGDTK